MGNAKIGGGLLNQSRPSPIQWMFFFWKLLHQGVVHQITQIAVDGFHAVEPIHIQLVAGGALQIFSTTTSLGFLEINTIIPAKSRLVVAGNLSQIALVDLISPSLGIRFLCFIIKTQTVKPRLHGLFWWR